MPKRTLIRWPDGTHEKVVVTRGRFRTKHRGAPVTVPIGAVRVVESVDEEAPVSSEPEGS